MQWWLIAGLSAALVAIGLFLLVKDLFKSLPSWARRRSWSFTSPPTGKSSTGRLGSTHRARSVSPADPLPTLADVRILAEPSPSLNSTRPAFGTPAWPGPAQQQYAPQAAPGPTTPFAGHTPDYLAGRGGHQRGPIPAPLSPTGPPAVAQPARPDPGPAQFQAYQRPLTPAHDLSHASPQPLEEPAGLPRDPTISERWQTIRHAVSDAVLTTNAHINHVAIKIDTSGVDGWSPGNSGFGHYRRVHLAGRSIAWLRIELQSGSRLILKLWSQGQDMAAINAIVDAGPLPLRMLDIERALQRTMEKTVAFASGMFTPAPHHARPAHAPAIAQPSRPAAAPPPPSPAPAAAPLASNSPSPPHPPADTTDHGITHIAQTAMRALSAGIEPIRTALGEALRGYDISSAVELVNEVFKDIQATITHDPGSPSTAPTHSGATNHYEIRYRGETLGRLLMSTDQERLHLAVQPSRSGLQNLIEAKSLPHGDLDNQMLAEAIAAIVWPTLAAEGADAHLP